MDTNKLYTITRNILEEIIKASDERIQDTMDYKLAKTIEKAKTKLELLKELEDGCPAMGLTGPGSTTVPTPHQGPNTITVPMGEHPRSLTGEPYVGHRRPGDSSAIWGTVPTIPAVRTACNTSDAWPPESHEPASKKGNGIDPFESGTTVM